MVCSEQVNRIRSMPARPLLQARFQLKVRPRPKPVSERNSQAMPPHPRDLQAGIMTRVGDIPLRKPGNAVPALRQLTPRCERSHDSRSNVIGKCRLQNDMAARRQH